MTIDFMGGDGIGYYYRKRRDCFASLAMTTNGSGGVRLPAVIARSPPFGDVAISLFTHKIKCHEPLVVKIHIAASLIRRANLNDDELGGRETHPERMFRLHEPVFSRVSHPFAAIQDVLFLVGCRRLGWVVRRSEGTHGGTLSVKNVGVSRADGGVPLLPRYRSV